MTYGVVLFTVLAQGVTIASVVQKLGLRNVPVGPAIAE
jgi:NhaP-type Na+/H+ or K+/H+ antiporter